MDILREVQSFMAFTGWKGDPASGFSHKEDATGAVIAKRGDRIWIADVEEATERAERVAIIEELERRGKS